MAARDARIEEMEASRKTDTVRFPGSPSTEKNSADDPATNGAPEFLEGEAVSAAKLVAYCSDQAHSCLEKSAKIVSVKIRVLKSRPDGSLCPESLREVREKHKSQ